MKEDWIVMEDVMGAIVALWISVGVMVGWYSIVSGAKDPYTIGALWPLWLVVWLSKSSWRTIKRAVKEW